MGFIKIFVIRWSNWNSLNVSPCFFPAILHAHSVSQHHLTGLKLGQYYGSTFKNYSKKCPVTNGPKCVRPIALTLTLKPKQSVSHGHIQTYVCLETKKNCVVLWKTIIVCFVSDGAPSQCRGWKRRGLITMGWGHVFLNRKLDCLENSKTGCDSSRLAKSWLDLPQLEQFTLAGWSKGKSKSQPEVLGKGSYCSSSQTPARDASLESNQTSFCTCLEYSQAKVYNVILASYYSRYHRFVCVNTSRTWPEEVARADRREAFLTSPKMEWRSS